MKNLDFFLSIMLVLVGCYAGFVVGSGVSQESCKNKVIEGYTIEVKYQTNSLGEVAIISKNWVKNEN